MRIPTHREPTHPGEMLSEEFLLPMEISPDDLAQAIHIPLQQIKELINRKRAVSPRLALRLAKFFGVSADYWLNLQVRWDLYQAQLTEKSELETIQNFHFLQKMA